MAATRLSGKVITVVNTLCSGVTGVTTGRGRVRYQENDDPEGALRAQAAETRATVGWFVDERTSPASSATTTGSLTIHGTVTIKLLTQQSSEMDQAYDLMDAIFETVMLETNYEVLGVKPQNGRWGRDSDDLENDIACFFVSITFQTGPICETL
jgi:hypothetical protein